MTRMMPWAAAAIALLFTTSSWATRQGAAPRDTVAAPAATIEVNPGESIQSAINIASAGDEILVNPGTYTESLEFLGKELTLRSSGGAGVTTIDGSAEATTVLRFVQMETAALVVEGFTVTGGTGFPFETSPGIFERRGGGAYCPDTASPTIQDCIFEGNEARRGGGVYYGGGGAALLIRCVFMNNTANGSGRGGGVYCDQNELQVVNCLFENNVAGSNGGGMHNSLSAGVSVINSTFHANIAQFSFGGGIYNDASNTFVTNSILWANADTSGVNETSQVYTGSGVPIVDFSVVQGGWSGVGGVGIVNQDPLFVDPPGGNFRLDDFSPCIDAGNNNAVPAEGLPDLDGNTRIVEDEGVTNTGLGTSPFVDMGAYERQVSSSTLLATVPVPFSTIQEGINATAISGTVNVAPGIYLERINFNGKNITVRATGGAALTTIDGGAGGSVVTFANGEGNPPLRLPRGPQAQIQGFTITNGSAAVGGGILIDGASPRVLNCILNANNAGLGGGIAVLDNSNAEILACSFTANLSGDGSGIYVESSSPVIADGIFDTNVSNSFGGGIYNFNDADPSILRCVFSGNGGNYGGAIYNREDCDPVIEDCTFEDNSAIDGGAIVNATNCSPPITRCSFFRNAALNRGGAIHNISECDPTILNCSFSRNEGRFGAAINCSNLCSPAVINCSFGGNIAEQVGGGFRCSEGQPSIDNSIFWGNLPDQIFEDFGAEIFVRTCDVEGGFPGTDVFDVDPLFVNTAIDDLRLQVTSPCVDLGDDALVPPGTILDLDGNDRFFSAAVDLGAYENQLAGCVADTTGDGNVDADDFLDVLADWGPCPLPCPPRCDSDIIPNCMVDTDDFLAVLISWGTCP